ncbi:hypothetical protein EIP91_001059 [Steccherinum ochraceum]|uniref:Uncharacterized protein n=1 Tax=Steccherinum ochraceum TaxID=92696 RepID=A0A4R0RVE5_9APHY|nr:hypothetical protein EIP91_001059 [Steccherinum ochraceum]
MAASLPEGLVIPPGVASEALRILQHHANGESGASPRLQKWLKELEEPTSELLASAVEASPGTTTSLRSFTDTPLSSASRPPSTSSNRQEKRARSQGEQEDVYIEIQEQHQRLVELRRNLTALEGQLGKMNERRAQEEEAKQRAKAMVRQLQAALRPVLIRHMLDQITNMLAWRMVPPFENGKDLRERCSGNTAASSAHRRAVIKSIHWPQEHMNWTYKNQVVM